MQRVHEALKEQDVVVLAISIDAGGEKTMQSFLKKYSQYTFSIPLDSRMDTARKFGVRGLPSTYVINRQGAVAAHAFGAVDFDTPEFLRYLSTLAAR